MLVPYTRGGWVAGSSSFTAMTNIFVTEFSEYRENSNDHIIGGSKGSEPK